MEKKHIVLYIGGSIFGAGLALSGMTKPEVVLSFLELKDFGLLLLMGTAVVISALSLQIGQRFLKKAPLTGLKYGRRNYKLEPRIIAGGVIFGVGWGLSGICPGAAFASIGTGNYPIFIAIGGMLIGDYFLSFFLSEELVL